MNICYIINTVFVFCFKQLPIMIFFKCLYCYSFLKIKCNKICKGYEYINNNYDTRFFINDNYVIIRDISEIKCDYNFLEIEYSDEYKNFNIHISDKNSSLSFMIVNNTILTNNFVKWYMDKYYNYKINNNYKINIIDHDANSIELNENESITLQKDAYVINKENVS